MPHIVWTLVQDPATGKPLPDDWLLAEMGTLFLAGFETTGHTMAWTLCAPVRRPLVKPLQSCAMPMPGHCLTSCGNCRPTESMCTVHAVLVCWVPGQSRAGS